MDPHHHQEPGSGYPDGSGAWGDGQHGGYHSQHHSPAQEYNGFVFQPMQMNNAMYATPGNMVPRTTHQQLQPLIMPQPQWPSMLTSQSTYAQPILSSATVPSAPHSLPISTPLSAPPATGRHPTPRKTLTDDDRKRMCLYAEQHPTVKQTEIGAMFGVERSTVSKVLRNKEKYLYQDDGSKSPARKPKGKFPDIERALSNWAKNHQKQGLPLTDALIKDKFRFFANTVGSSENLPKSASNSWLEKFKQKNGLMGAKSRKNSIAEESENASNPASGAQTPGNLSPASPQAVGTERSPSAMVTSKSEENLKEGSPSTYSDLHQGHRPYHSLSNDSLASSFAGGVPPAFSPGSHSPTSPYFTSEYGAPFVSQPHNQSRTPSTVAGTQAGYSRPRSQTFPLLSMEPYVSPPSSEPLTPKYVSSTILESPLPEMTMVDEEHAIAGAHSMLSMQPPPQPSAPVGFVSDMHSRQGMPSHAHISQHTYGPPLHMPSTSRSSSVMLHSSPLTPSSAVSGIPPPPSSPSLEDTRRALEVVMAFFAHQPPDIANPQELMTMGALMEKLKLQTGQSPVVRGGEMPGGMHRIPSGDFKIGRSMGE